MSFKDIRGQNKPIEILKSALRRASVTGSYLFVGQEAIGKYLTAINFAKAVNCLNLKDDACDVCASCLKISKKGHADVHFIDPNEAGAIKIEHIRNLKKEINLRSYEAKRKVFIINDAHSLTADASDALLKILEEPPLNSSIILVSSKPALLFKTIVSRCQTLKFYPLDRAELKETIKKGYRLSEELAHFLAYFSEGRIGLALRMKDADILKDKNRIIDEFILFNKPRFIEDLSLQNREEISRYLNMLAAWFRDMTLIKVGIPHSELINLDRKNELLKFMGHYTWVDLDRIFNSIANSIFYLGHNINIKLLLYNLKAELWRG